MPSHTPFELAQQGDPQAIAQLLNETLRPHNVQASTLRRDRVLLVLLESTPPPTYQEVLPPVHAVLAPLGIDSIDTVKVYGRRVGEGEVVWGKTLSLSAAAVKPSPSVHSEASAQPQTGAAAIAHPAVSPKATTPESTIAVPTNNEAVPAPVPPLPQPLAVAAPVVAPQPVTQLPVQPLTDPSVAVPAPEEPATATSETAPEWVVALRPFLERPETVVLVVVAIVLIFWDAYQEILEEVTTSSLSGRKLAERLGVSRSMLHHHRDLGDLSEWSCQLDPAGIAWSYRNGVYEPLGQKLSETL